MIGYVVSLIVFNLAVFCANKRLSPGQIVQIWTFTIASHLAFDVYIDYKYHGYWYFTKGVDCENLPGMICLLPPVNILYLNWFPFGKRWPKKILYPELFTEIQKLIITYGLPSLFGFIVIH